MAEFCGGRRMAERSARLIDQVFPDDFAAAPPENPVLIPTADVAAQPLVRSRQC
jgi:hypothetical protein